MTDRKKLIVDASEIIGTAPDYVPIEDIAERLLVLFERAHTDRETLARWLHMRFGHNQSKVWEELSDRLKQAWLDLAENAPNYSKAEEE